MNDSKPILITGMKHSGKSTSGRKTAHILGMDFIDMDNLIEELYSNESGQQLDARGIYRKGREIFQEYEYKAANLLSTRNQDFIAAAGGGICDNEPACVKLKNFTWIYIDEEPGILFERIKRGGIPAFLTGDDPFTEFLDLYNRRSSIYKELCDMKITAGGRTPPQICLEIINNLREAGYGRK